MDFVVELRHVLNFLQQNGFEKAAEAVYERLENANVDVKQTLDAEERDGSPSSAPEYGGEYADQLPEEEYRSKSAEPVLVSSRCVSGSMLMLAPALESLTEQALPVSCSRGASEEDETPPDGDAKEQSPWYPPEPLTTRLSGEMAKETSAASFALARSRSFCCSQDT